jgi:exodeoxyribonuclease V beta subunit
VPVASLEALGVLGRKANEPPYPELRDARAGTFVTSYTRMQSVRSRGSGWAEHAEARRAEKVAASADGAQARSLPGSRASGVFLHELLERVPLASFATASYGAWCARPDVARLLGESMAVHRVAPAARERAAQMIWATFTTPMTLPDGKHLDGLARADRLAREMDFVYPLPGSDQGYVRGSLDLAFDLGGKTYFVDYKSDTLASYAPAALEAHVRSHYDDQIRLYSIAVARLLGVSDAAAHQRRFGGIVYMFLRGLESADSGLWSARPGWDDVARWQRDLETGSGWGAAATARNR